MVENVIQIKSGITINVGASVKKHRACEKDYIWNPATCSCENGKYLASITDNSMTACDEIIEETGTVTTNFNDKNVICTTKNLYNLFAFLLITIALLLVFTVT